MNDNRRSLEHLIDNLETQINEMQQRAAQVEDDARVEYERRIEDLKNQKHEAEQQLAELESEGSSAVDDITTGIQQAWSDIKDSVSDAVSRLR